jgi:hypothetical protein
VALFTTITRWSFLRSWVSNLKELEKLASKLHVHSVNYAAKFVHTRRALSSTVSSGDGFRSSLLLLPNDLSFFFWWNSFTVPGTKWLFLN